MLAGWLDVRAPGSAVLPQAPARLQADTSKTRRRAAGGAHLVPELLHALPQLRHIQAAAARSVELCEQVAQAGHVAGVHLPRDDQQGQLLEVRACTRNRGG